MTACDYENYLNLNNSIYLNNGISTIYDFFKYTSVNTTLEIDFLNEIPGISLSEATKLVKHIFPWYMPSDLSVEQIIKFLKAKINTYF